MKPITFLLFAFSITISQVTARTWTQQATGKTIEAEYQGTTGRGDSLKVNLRLEGRRTIPILLSTLSEEDQNWVKDQIANGSKTAESAGDDGDGTSRVLGKWKGFMANSDGDPDSPISLVITKDTITAMRFSGEAMGTGTYRIRGDGKMRIDVKGTSGDYDGKDYEGIISVEGKTLKWCSTNDNESARRPREFQTDIQQNHFLMVMEREE